MTFNAVRDRFFDISTVLHQEMTAADNVLESVASWDVYTRVENNTELGRPTISSEPHISLNSRSFRLILGPVIIPARDLDVWLIFFLISVQH